MPIAQLAIAAVLTLLGWWLMTDLDEAKESTKWTCKS